MKIQARAPAGRSCALARGGRREGGEHRGWGFLKTRDRQPFWGQERHGCSQPPCNRRLHPRAHVHAHARGQRGCRGCTGGPCSRHRHESANESACIARNHGTRVTGNHGPPATSLLHPPAFFPPIHLHLILGPRHLWQRDRRMGHRRTAHRMGRTARRAADTAMSLRVLTQRHRGLAVLTDRPAPRDRPTS